MGYYIQVPQHRNKAQQLIELYGAESLWKNKTLPMYECIPTDKAAICVLNNGMFEAAGYAYSEKEYMEFLLSGRCIDVLLMDKAKVHELTHFNL